MKYPRAASTTRPVSTPMRKMSQFAESSTAASASRDIRRRLRNNAVYSPNRDVIARSSRHTSQDHTTRCALISKGEAGASSGKYSGRNPQRRQTPTAEATHRLEPREGEGVM